MYAKTLMDSSFIKRKVLFVAFKDWLTYSLFSISFDTVFNQYKTLSTRISILFEAIFSFFLPHLEQNLSSEPILAPQLEQKFIFKVLD